jgi:hypothetical protein
MVALGSRLTVSIEPAVRSDLQSASSTAEKLAILGIAAGRGTAAVTDADGTAIQPECVKPFGDAG